jgi:hypothetical protein
VLPHPDALQTANGARPGNTQLTTMAGVVVQAGYTFEGYTFEFFESSYQLYLKRTLETDSNESALTAISENQKKLRRGYITA